MRINGVSSHSFYSLLTMIILCISTSYDLYPRNDYKSFKSIFTHAEKQLFMEWMNKDRKIRNVPPVEYMKDVERLADVRIETINKHRKDILNSITKKEYRKNFLYHLHFGMYEDIEGFNINLRDDPKNRYIMLRPSENIAMFFENDGKLLYSLFDGWKHSPSHWEGMMDEFFTHMALEMKKTDQGYYACLILLKKFDKKKK